MNFVSILSGDCQRMVRLFCGTTFHSALHSRLKKVLVKIATALLLSVAAVGSVQAYNITVVNSAGFDTFYPKIQTAIQSLGHVVTVVSTFPSGISPATTPWVLMFGNADYRGSAGSIKAYINAGGKVLYQYEVNCCEVSSASAAAIATAIANTGVTYTNPGPSGNVDQSRGYAPAPDVYGYDGSIAYGACSASFQGALARNLTGDRKSVV